MMLSDGFNLIDVTGCLTSDRDTARLMIQEQQNREVKRQG